MADEERDAERPVGRARPPAGRDHLRVLDPEREPAAIKALTHPLRVRLLGLLRMDGPATASELAARTGESSASTSYHLRVLAKYAFVAEAEHRDGRERRWRAVHAVTTWDHAAMEASPVGREFTGKMARRQIDHLGESLGWYEAARAAGRVGREWLEPSGITDLLPTLTPESLSELKQTFEDKLEELTARDAGEARAEKVVVFFAGLPVVGRVEGDAGDRPAEGADGADRAAEVDGAGGADRAAEVDGAGGADQVVEVDVAAEADEAGAAPRRVRGYTHD
ncbi:ArsR/SmtB family transcription factor [Streptomyces alboflavus]|uniref:ArsR/SmtB family transcription factor n=1 Tax=Streptomyces alboflavus TaxID=67267 RepID=UPI000B42862C|nr:winged helix-turn-helix domain-containing protein [Streptomyces alboflavus]